MLRQLLAEGLQADPTPVRKVTYPNLTLKRSPSGIHRTSTNTSKPRPTSGENSGQSPPPTSSSPPTSTAKKPGNTKKAAKCQRVPYVKVNAFYGGGPGCFGERVAVPRRFALALGRWPMGRMVTVRSSGECPVPATRSIRQHAPLSDPAGRSSQDRGRVPCPTSPKAETHTPVPG